MQVTIELTPNQEEQLRAAAEAEGLDLSSLAQKWVTEHLPAASPDPDEAYPDHKRQAAIAMLESWIAESTTDDPELIRRAEEEVEEFKRNMNANRANSAETLVFP